MGTTSLRRPAAKLANAWTAPSGEPPEGQT